MSGRPLYSHKYDHLIPSLRQEVLDQLSQNPVLKTQVYAEDISRVQTSDKWLMRFLEYFSGDVKSSRDKLLTSMKFQKELGLRDMSDEYFPRELWELGSMRLYGKDKDGRPVGYLRLKFLRKEKMIREMIKRFIGYLFIRLERESEGTEGAILIADFEGLSLSNFNLDICLFTLGLKDKFPLVLKHLIVLSVPWFASAFCNCTMRFAFPAHVRDMMLFLSGEELRNYVEDNQLPYFLNGSSNEAYDGEKCVPTGAPKMIDFAANVLRMDEKEGEMLRQLAVEQKERFLLLPDVNKNYE